MNRLRLVTLVALLASAAVVGFGKQSTPVKVKVAAASRKLSENRSDSPPPSTIR